MRSFRIESDVMDPMIKNRSLDSIWDAIESHLMGVKRAAAVELRNYPQPIAGCDAQIPVLWEKRDGIAAELDRLSKARQRPTIDAGSAINAFIATSPFIDDDQKQKFRTLATPTTPKTRSAVE